MQREAEEITGLLAEARRGNRAAADQLFEAVSTDLSDWERKVVQKLVDSAASKGLL